MSIESGNSQETPESKVIHSVYTCPACEFSSMKQTLVYVEHDFIPERIVNHYRRVETWECRSCGFEEDYEFYNPPGIE